MTLFVTLDLVRRERRTVATPALHSRQAERLYATTMYVGALIEKIIYICSSKTPSSRYLSGLKKGALFPPHFPLIFPSFLSKFEGKQSKLQLFVI
jgi:hypothetical protein